MSCGALAPCWGDITGKVVAMAEEERSAEGQNYGMFPVETLDLHGWSLGRPNDTNDPPPSFKRLLI